MRFFSRVLRASASSGFNSARRSSSRSASPLRRERPARRNFMSSCAWSLSCAFSPFPILQARLLQLRRLARAFLLLGGLEPRALLLFCGFGASRVFRLAGLLLFARDPGTGGFIRLEPANLLSFLFLRRPGTCCFAGL